MKPKGVTTQMKALDEYFLMVAGVHIVAEQTSCSCNSYIGFVQKNVAVKALK